MSVDVTWSLRIADSECDFLSDQTTCFPTSWTWAYRAENIEPVLGEIVTGAITQSLWEEMFGADCWAGSVVLVVSSPEQHAGAYELDLELRLAVMAVRKAEA